MEKPFNNLVLSLFPGIDLLGRGFELEGFCIVRGPDLIWGQAIESFHAPRNCFEGIIAGSPCQGFSKANRTPDREKSEAALDQFKRIVTEAQPEWWLLENVPTVPDVRVDNYKVQRFDLSARECGLRQSRLRHFQFGSKSGLVLIPERESSRSLAPGQVTLEPCCLASEGTKQNRRNFADFCELQGLPRDFDLPGWSTAFKYAAVGNGVPIPVARVIARAIVTARSKGSPARSQRLCACDCGCVVRGRQVSATSACRKRLQRKRERPGQELAWRVTNQSVTAQRKKNSGVSQL